MTDAFLDTNVILRYLLGDHPTMSPRSTELMRELEAGSKRVFISDMVLAEVVWIATSSVFQLTRSAISQRLSDIVRYPGIFLVDKRIALEALDLFANTRVDFIDAYNAATMKRRGIETIYSYDRDFDGLAGITRVEP